MSKRKRVKLQPHHHRVTIGWEPKWEPEIRNWASKLISTNLWRYDPIVCSHADLMQDAYLQFIKVREAYPRVFEPKHFMALYKTTLMRHLCDQATKNIQRKEVEITPDIEVEIFADDMIKELDNDGYLTILCQEAPADIRAVLELFLDDSMLEELRKPRHRPFRGLSPRETLNERLCSLIDTSHLTSLGRERVHIKYDIVSRIKSWISDQPIGRKGALDYVAD